MDLSISCKQNTSDGGKKTIVFMQVLLTDLQTKKTYLKVKPRAKPQKNNKFSKAKFTSEIINFRLHFTSCGNWQLGKRFHGFL